MSLSYSLFDALRTFDNFRREARTEYEDFRRRNERFRGSSGYAADMKAAAAKRKSATDFAREKASEKINEYIAQMRANAGKVAITPPTPEQVSILQVLSMKQKVPKQELDRAAQSMNGNSFALSALNDIADKHYYPGSPEGNYHTNYLVNATDLSDTAVENYLRSIVNACRDRLKTSATKAALEGAVFQWNTHGISYDEDNLPQKKELVSERGFYGEIIPESHYDAFMKAVNGE